MQAIEGVSLDAQSEKIKAYCKLHDVELIGICKDEGLSANSLERPGLKSALAMLERGKANTLLVVKLDRLTRSLLDLDMLIRGYFAERFHLLSVSESLDMRTAMGRFVLYILGLIAQWEREAIGERTREAMAHLKLQGVPLGAAPYGYCYSAERDADGRKRLVEIPAELEVIARILELFDDGTSARQIAERLAFCERLLDMKTDAPIDMTTPPPKCDAAKGLPGDNLLCINFSSVLDQTLANPPPQMLSGWDFNNPPNCWEVAAGQLQIKGFSGFMSNCSFMLPAVKASDYSKYNHFTLAVVQSLDLNTTGQRAQIMMGLDDPVDRLVDWATGKQATQQRIYAIDKTALPNGGNGYQPLFKIISSVMVGSTAQGWKIKSIAVNASE